MPIDPDFPKNSQVIGKHVCFDGEHFVWGPGKVEDASANPDVRAAYAARNEEIVPLGVHGTFVAVDWDSCIADGICLLSCPVKVFEWYKNPGETGRNDKKDYTDKAIPVKEAHCIWCMACVEVCPTKAIKVDQANQEIHEKEIANIP